MTNQAPPPKASSVSALLASFSTESAAPEPSANINDDFLAVILQALTGSSGKKADHSNTSQPAHEKPQATATSAPDALAASMLLALLTPHPANLPAPTKPAALASKTGTATVVPSATAAAAAAPGLSTAQSANESKSAKPLALRLLPALPEQKAHESKTPPQDGTSAANATPRMSFNTERNEVAGRKEQNLPITAISAVSSTDTGSSSSNDSGSKLPLSLAWHEAPSEQLAIIDLSSKASNPFTLEAAPTVEASIQPPSPADRLQQMISSEALTIRQIGAQSLGVSLKVDDNTQLFLQLTNHNGQVQASLRCEKGQFSTDDAQWAQLKQSLAQQNVELMPISGAAGSNLEFQQSPGEHSRQPASRQEWPAASAAVQPVQQRKQQQKEQNRSRKNWESWA